MELDMSSIMEQDECRKYDFEKRVEPIISQLIKDSANKHDSIKFAPEFFKEHKNFWMRKIMEVA